MKLTKIGVHVLFWVWYTAGVVLFPDAQMLGEMSRLAFFVKQSSLYAVFIAYFYYVYLLLVPKLLQQRSIQSTLWFVLACGVGIAVGCGLLLAHGVFVEHALNTPGFAALRLENISYFPSQFILFTFAGVLFRLAVDWFQERGRVESLEHERRESELAMLRSQIAPHFLFNSLNNIYSLLRTNTQRGSAAILQLADLMRYAIHREVGATTLNDEFNHLTNFVSLQKLRLTDACDVQLHLPDAPPHLLIEPMLLISFVENAFKHTDVSAASAYIHIHASLNTENLLHFEVQNNPAVSSDEESHGIGLRNVQRRLELVYPDKHVLTISASSTYVATLEVNL